jgi:hypothetical protein
MIQKFVTRFDAAREELRAKYTSTPPSDYAAIVEDVVRIVGASGEEWRRPDPARITRIDHGDYQGTLLFVVASTGYQPDTFWAVKISYGSCSGCDTFEAITAYGPYSGPPTEKQVTDYLTLALHVVQGIEEIGGAS